MSSKIEVPQSEWIVASNPSTPVVERQQCCTPTPEEKKLLAAGDYTPEELWGGNRPTCPKCINAAPPELAELQAKEPDQSSWPSLKAAYDKAQAAIAKLTAEIERLKSESFEELYNAVIDERNALAERLKGGQGELAAWEYYSKPLRSWRPLENEADKSKAESMGCQVRAVSSATTVAVDAAKAFAKGFNTLETLDGRYKIVMQFAGHDDAWAAYTSLSQMTACLDKVKELNQ